MPFTAPRFWVVSCANRRLENMTAAIRKQALAMQRAVLQNPHASLGISPLALHFSLRAKKPAPDTKLGNPADLVNQFAFLARELLLIPHHAALRFPAHVYSRRKRRNGKGGCITSNCGHHIHLLALELPKVSLLRLAFLVVYCIPGSISKWFRTALQFYGESASD